MQPLTHLKRRSKTPLGKNEKKEKTVKVRKLTEIQIIN